MGTAFLVPICNWCKHYNRERIHSRPSIKCTAFPEGIPEAIWFSSADHRKPYEGDNGIVYEEVSESEFTEPKIYIEVTGISSKTWHLMAFDRVEQGVNWQWDVSRYGNIEVKDNTE